MRPHQVFARMSPDQAEALFRALSADAPAVAAQALAAAGAAMKARPVYLKRQPLERRAAAVRRSLARVGADPLAEEVLAVYFLECRKPLLVEWLDLAGVTHEDGTLGAEVPPEPDSAALEAAVARFRQGEDPAERELLLQAFASQGAIGWPTLDALVEASD